ncbi:Uma2 family endonuclease [Oscillatoria salina]|uniref:Uma2 family endonuclease n=1 Tax=Oscillatoria salina TaxID=331517 RepID=UPI001CCE0A14|nr:Uma2 family endonuclease [Oscillatoria salina]MBZ8178736.1 Uma2 family endonuclease [Oscillatoria salina IIICB1]
MTTAIAHWTLAEYHRMIETGLLVSRRVELLKGLIVEMSPEGPAHAEKSTDTMELSIGAAQGRYRVRAAKPITIEESNSEPEPHLALVKPQSYLRSHPSPADVYLIIEFANSSLAKDTEEKRLVYAIAEINDYWVVDLISRQLIIYRHPNNGDYTSEQRLTSGSVSLLAFPDVSLPVTRLLA